MRNLREFLDQEAIRAGTLVVAVSGGPDSVALLLGLREAVSEDTQLVAAHLNHELRGDESDGDQAFVEDLCRGIGVRCVSDRRNVKDAAAVSSENLEAVARRLRYEWLAKVAGDVGAKWIATGHTADDQAETVLHNIIRGTGLRGLRGIARRKPLQGGIELIRPMLAIRRTDVLAFLEDRQVVARADSTNESLEFTRNRIRHRLMPELWEEYNPEIAVHLAQLAEHAQSLFPILDERVQTLLGEAEKPKAGDVVVLDAVRLAVANRFLVRELFHWIFEREAWPLSRMNYARWSALEEMVFADSRAVDLPEGVLARKKGNVIQLRRKLRNTENP